MKIVDIHEAKTHLSRLVEKVCAGEPFIIAKAGRPVAKVVAFNAHDQLGKKRLGFMEGQIQIPDDFDRLDAEMFDK